MDFFRARANINKNGKEEQRFAFVYGNKIDEIEYQLKKFQLVKEFGFIPKLNLTKITESEFIVGVLLCSENDFCSSENVGLAELDMICGKLCRLLDGGYKFQTEEGKSLKKYCDKFMTANKKAKKHIESDYVNWARELVGVEENQ